jgi:hypothetical protein
MRKPQWSRADNNDTQKGESPAAVRNIPGATRSVGAAIIALLIPQTGLIALALWCDEPDRIIDNGSAYTSLDDWKKK